MQNCLNTHGVTPNALSKKHKKEQLASFNDHASVASDPSQMPGFTKVASYDELASFHRPANKLRVCASQASSEHPLQGKADVRHKKLFSYSHYSHGYDCMFLSYHPLPHIIPTPGSAVYHTPNGAGNEHLPAVTAAYTLTRGAFAGKAGREAATKGADREQQYVGGSAIMKSSMHPHLKAEFEGIKGNLRANHQHEAAAVLELDHALVAVYDVDSVGQACHQGTPPTFTWSLFLMSLVHEQTPCECAAAISMESKPCVGMSDLAVGSRQAQVACVITLLTWQARLP
jgi:hypothetical protein